MSFREQLQAYIAELEKRLRWGTLLRGLAILTGSALLATLVLVAIANALAFSQGSVTSARFALILILIVAAAAGLALPLRRLTRRRRAPGDRAAPPWRERDGLPVGGRRPGRPGRPDVSGTRARPGDPRWRAHR